MTGAELVFSVVSQWFAVNELNIHFNYPAFNSSCCVFSDDATKDLPDPSPIPNVRIKTFVSNYFFSVWGMFCTYMYNGTWERAQ